MVKPEVFGSVAIVLGAYVWREERDSAGNYGLMILILGIVGMLVGTYFTAYFSLFELIPNPSIR